MAPERRYRGAGRAGAALLAAVLSLGPATAGEPVRCAEAPVAVTAADAQTAAAACAMARRATQIFAACGFTPPREVRLTVTDEIIGGDPACMGAYHCTTDEIEVLSAAGLDRHLPSAHPLRALSLERWSDSLVAHEVVHALVYHARGGPGPSPVGDEYLAYALQIGLLSEADRAALLAAYPVPEGAAPQMLNAFILALSPMRFGTVAWAHFSAEPEACETLRSVIDIGHPATRTMAPPDPPRGD